MSNASILFPHQLYPKHPGIKKGQDIYLIEEFLFFRQYRFHRSKLVFHRASMKAYADALTSKGHTVHYLEATKSESDIRNLIPFLHKKGIRVIEFCDPTDEWLMRRIKKTSAECGIQCILHPSPNFIADTNEPIAGRKQPIYFQTDFYIRQRKKHGWLMQSNGKPIGDQWSFDADNRKALPKGMTIPSVPVVEINKYQTEAITYVNKHFAGHYGESGNCMFPTDRATSLQWLDAFLKNRFASFGEYEDAMHADELLLFHSGLTPMLNVGLLTPQEIIDKSLAFAASNNIPLASVEGFLRQITGWREFIRLVYVQAGNKQRSTNYWKFTRKIPESFWTGNTGIVPVDQVIKKLLRTGYSHHIERLMILGNFMLLCEFDPDEVYRWFMTLYIDAYDWVMVPNVYGMTQFADGGLMTTKPYISGSNYVMKMGKWEKGEWQAIWDGLFWRFMDKQRAFLTQNPRLGMLIKTWDKMDASKRKTHLQNAERFLKTLDT